MLRDRKFSCFSLICLAGFACAKTVHTSRIVKHFAAILLGNKWKESFRLTLIY